MNEESISYYNLDHLIRIKTRLKEKSTWYSWKPEQKILFGLITWQYEGIYSAFNQYKGLELENHYVENNVVYECPHVELVFADNLTYTKFFIEQHEASEYSQYIIDKLKKPVVAPANDILI